jgi:hypothetical protein
MDLEKMLRRKCCRQYGEDVLVDGFGESVVQGLEG